MCPAIETNYAFIASSENAIEWRLAVGRPCVVEEFVEFGGAAERESEDVAVAVVDASMATRCGSVAENSTEAIRERLMRLWGRAVEHGPASAENMCYLGYRTSRHCLDGGFASR